MILVGGGARLPALRRIAPAVLGHPVLVPSPGSTSPTARLGKRRGCSRAARSRRDGRRPTWRSTRPTRRPASVSVMRTYGSSRRGDRTPERAPSSPQAMISELVPNEVDESKIIGSAMLIRDSVGYGSMSRSSRRESAEIPVALEIDGGICEPVLPQPRAEGHHRSTLPEQVAVAGAGLRWQPRYGSGEQVWPAR